MNLTIAAGLFCLSLGVWWVWAAFGARERRVALLRNCMKARGRVTRLEDASSEGDTLSWWAPIVTYTAQDGTTHEHKMSPQSDREKYPVGSKVPVFYESGSPGNATTQRRMWDVNLACALSFVPVLLGFGFLYTAYQEIAPRLP